MIVIRGSAMTLDDTNAARLIACNYHKGQMYGNRQYWTHLDNVQSSVAISGGSDEEICVAWLHDILEDTECTEEVLRRNFDSVVVDAVVAITKVMGESYEDYICKVKANKIAHKVKMHDTLKNLSESVRAGQMGRVRKYAAQMQFLVDD